MAFDKSKFIEQFKAETADHIQKITQGLLKLEKNNRDKELLEVLMREAHTIKGSAVMMGYKRISEIAHKMEDGFQAALEGKVDLEKRHFDIIFKCLDTIEPLLEDKLTWEDKGINRPYVEELCAKVEAVFKGQALPAGEAPRKEAGQEPQASPAQAEREIKPAPPLASEEHIRVDIDKLDKLMNISGELLISQTRLGELVKGLALKIDSPTSTKQDIAVLATELKAVDENINLITSDIQDEVMKVRMVDIAHLFNMFPRAMRDLALEKGKDIEIQIKGENTQLDKMIIDEIKDPIMHILRNAVDHGIEPPQERQKKNKPATGKIVLDAYQRGAHVVIEVADDGRGIDAKRVREEAVKKGIIPAPAAAELIDEQLYQLLFMPGFSTQETVTETSGRGVGLDVVRERVARLKGMVEVSSQPDIGTKFILKIPLTLAIMESLLVASGSDVFAIPIDAVVETIRINPNEIKTVESKKAIAVRGHIIPLVSLNEIFGLPERGIIEKRYLQVVVVQAVEKKMGLLVNQLLGRQEIVRKSLRDPLKNVRDISGATILGDGRVILILDIPSIIQYAQGVVIKQPMPSVRPAQEQRRRKTILLADDALSTAMLEKNVLEAAGFSVVIAHDGREALDKLAQEKFDLLITDVLMPRMDGFELTAKVKKDNLYKDMPVIIVTTRETDADKRRGMEAGAEAYILKSEFTSEGLLETIERLIG